MTGNQARRGLIRTGDRFFTREELTTSALTVWTAPHHTGSVEVTLPAGTVLVALDQVPGASGFGAYPEEYEVVEQRVVPASVREDANYRAYYLSFATRDIDTLLDSLPALEPRPQNRLPRS